jgi:hypothetical protein
MKVCCAAVGIADFETAGHSGEEGIDLWFCYHALLMGWMCR